MNLPSGVHILKALYGTTIKIWGSQIGSMCKNKTNVGHFAYSWYCRIYSDILYLKEID